MQTPYPACENNLRDHLWMWGHDPGDFDGPNGEYDIPLSAPMSMAEGIESMGIPNVCVIRSGTPDEEYRRQFKNVKRIAWKLANGYSKASYHALKEYVFGLRDTTPNLTGYYLDDFFWAADRTEFEKNSETEPAPSALSLAETRQLHEETLAYPRRLDLGIVLYTGQLYPAIKPVMKLRRPRLALGLERQRHREHRGEFLEVRALVPDKPTLLGLYMWTSAARRN